ncbi:uncharacterized protein [Heptranchias perlo]|uniref:uncharacterized protein n=1 Tax=Heptranchias perlo TaxID=212740 RepID=UPI00355A65E9
MAEGGGGAARIACSRCQRPFELPESPSATPEHLPYLLQCEHVFCGTCLKVQYINSDSIICLFCQVPTPVDAEIGVEALPLDKCIIGALYTEKMLQNSKTTIQMATEDPEVDNEQKKENEENKLDVAERKLHQKCKRMTKENSELDSYCFEKIYWSQKAINVRLSTSESFAMEEAEACKDMCPSNVQFGNYPGKLAYQREKKQPKEKNCSSESRKWTREQQCTEKNKNLNKIWCGEGTGGLQAKLKPAESKGRTSDYDAERNVIGTRYVSRHFLSRVFRLTFEVLFLLNPVFF